MGKCVDVQGDQGATVPRCESFPCRPIHKMIPAAQVSTELCIVLEFVMTLADPARCHLVVPPLVAKLAYNNLTCKT